MESEPQKLFGGLLSIFGFVLVSAGSGMAPSINIDLYSIILGIGYLVSGICFYRGSQFGVTFSNITLLCAWMLALKNYQNSSSFIYAVALPSILSAYINLYKRQPLNPSINEMPVRNLSERGRAITDAAADGTLGGINLALKIFVALVIFFAAKSAVNTSNSVSLMIYGSGKPFQTLWVLMPFLLLAYALLAKRMFAIMPLVAVSIFVALFGTGVYGMIPSSHAVKSDANVFIWSPIVQLCWIFGCFHVFRRNESND